MKKVTVILLSVFFITQLNAQWVQTNGPFGFQSRGVAVSGNNIYLLLANEVYRSTDQGTTWVNITPTLNSTGWLKAIISDGSNVILANGAEGIFRSTDNGTTWTKSNSGLTDLGAQKLHQAGGSIYAGTSGGKVFLSADNGLSWTSISTGLPANQITGITKCGSNLIVGTHSQGLFYSTNNGTSWNASNNSALQNTYIRTIASDGVTALASCWPGLVRSTDNGVSWTIVPDAQWNFDALAIQGNTVYGCLEGSPIKKSTDKGTNWFDSANGFYSSYCYQIVLNNSNIYAAATSALFISSNEGTSWTMHRNGIKNSQVWKLFGDGNTLYSAGVSGIGISLTTNNGASWNPIFNSAFEINSLAADGNKVYCGNGNLGFHKSIDGGNNWVRKVTGIAPSYAWVFDILAEGNKIFAATSNGIFISNDGAENWTRKNAGITDNYTMILLRSGTRLFLGTDSKGVFVSTDEGETWTQTGLTDKKITTLKVLNNKIFAGTTTNGIYVSADNGLTWTQRNNGLGGLYIYSLESYNNILFSTNNEMEGLFYSRDEGLTWLRAFSNLPKLTVFNLKVHGTNLYSATNGSGVWSRSLSDFEIAVPGQVTSLQPTTINQTNFQAKWNSVSGALGYLLDVATDAAFTNLLSDYNKKDVFETTQFTVTGLTANTPYYFRVFAYNLGGISQTGNSIQVTTLMNAPNAPVSTAASNITSSGFTANWNPASAATEYFLDVSTNSSFTQIVTAYNNKSVGNVTSYAVTGLGPITDYFYRVRAKNNGGTSSNSNAITVTTLLAAPTAPILTGNGIITQTSFKATWQAGIGASKYFIDVATNENFTSFVSGYENKEIGNVTSFLIYGLQPNTDYSCRVRAFNSAGTTASSNYVNIKTKQNTQWIQTTGPITTIGGAVNTGVRFFMKMDNKVYGCAYYGAGLFESTDNGLNWKKIMSATTDVVNVVNDGTNIYAGTNGTGIYVSTDKGATWTQKNSGLTNLKVYSLAVNGANIYAATDGDGVFLSTNKGDTWTAINNGLSQKNINTVLSNGTTLFAGSSSAGVFISSNNGTSWTQTSLTGKNIIYLKAINNKIYAATWGSGVYVSSDNGTTWTQINSGLTNLFCLMLTLHSNNDFFCTTVDGIFYSKNSGTTWTNITANLPSVTYWTVDVSGNYLLAGSNELGVFRRTLSEVITDVNKKDELPAQFSLSQNYPNPFNPETKIDYSIATAGHVELTIFDLLGNKIATLVNEFKQPGFYSSKFLTQNSSLSSGIYFYRLQVYTPGRGGSYSETKKLSLLK